MVLLGISNAIIYTAGWYYWYYLYSKLDLLYIYNLCMLLTLYQDNIKKLNVQ